METVPLRYGDVLRMTAEGRCYEQLQDEQRLAKALVNACGGTCRSVCVSDQGPAWEDLCRRAEGWGSLWPTNSQLDQHRPNYGGKVRQVLVNVGRQLTKVHQTWPMLPQI